MNLSIFAGSSNPMLAEGMAAALGISLGERVLERYPDGELHVEIMESVRGRDVFLIQPTAPPVEEHLIELLLLADACHRAGASRLTAVVPYFGYARQDRRVSGRQPVGARVVADLLGTSAVERVVAVDLHSPAVEAALPVPLEHLSAVPLLAEAAREPGRDDRVVVAPDLGATKLAEQYATLLNLPVAIVHKTRLGGDSVIVRRITGQVRDRVPIVVDDIIGTGGTIEAAVDAVLQAGGRPDVTIVATHALLMGPALDRLIRLPLRRLIVTDSVQLPDVLPVAHEVVSLAPLLATTIARLHSGESLEDLIARR
ncbi:MAG: ribose-phosphate pyrophosphokinase [Chloroflexi bacterium]|nr:ribose-phosphate pyrophosphokinase [Chloroflexota bacterium]